MIRVATSALSGGILAALVPVVALLLLEPARYGPFSVIYLIFAFGLSVQYSALSEAWARKRREHEAIEARLTLSPDADWRAYSGMLVTVAITFGVAACITALLVLDLRADAAVLGGAVSMGVYRSGARYFTAAERSLTRVFLSDVSGIVALVVVLIFTFGDSISSLAIPWLASGVASAAVLRLPSLRWGNGPIRWVSTHWPHIRPLLLDSLLMDAGAIGTPFLLAGFMGPARFGVYRAVSNVALPVRLLIDPLRPILGRMSLERLLNRTATTMVVVSALVLSVACFIVLLLIVPSLPFEIGTLSALAEFALPCSVFVIGSLVGTVYYIVCRAHAAHRRILFGRIFQTAIVIVLPLLGAITWNLPGAIWGFTISSCMSAFVWAGIARSSTAKKPSI